MTASEDDSAGNRISLSEKTKSMYAESRFDKSIQLCLIFFFNFSIIVIISSIDSAVPFLVKSLFPPVKQPQHSE